MKRGLISIILITMLLVPGLAVAGPFEDLLDILGFGTEAVTGMNTANTSNGLDFNSSIEDVDVGFVEEEKDNLLVEYLLKFVSKAIMRLRGH